MLTITEFLNFLAFLLGLQLDASGKINGIAPSAADYTQAALQRTKVILSTLANVPNGFNTDNLTRLLKFNSGENFRFLLVKNSSIDAVLAGVTPATAVLFADPSTQEITSSSSSSPAFSQA